MDSWRSNQDDSEDENQCALSENWTFQHDQKKWSRTRTNEPLQPLQTITTYNTDNICLEHPNPTSPLKKTANPRYDLSILMDGEDISLARSGSEKIKDGAKAFLRRVESLKTRRRKRQNREGMVINKDTDILCVQQKMNLSIPTLVLPKNFDGDNNVSSEHSPKAVSPQISPSLNSSLLSPRRLFVHSPLLFHGREDTPRRAFVNRRGSVSLDRRDTVEVLSDSELQRTNKKLRNVDKIKHDGHLAVSDYESDIDDFETGGQYR